MTNGKHAALREARELLRRCREQPTASGEPTLALLVQAMERLADAIEADAPAEAGGNTAIVDDMAPVAGQQFDRARPARGYNRGE